MTPVPPSIAETCQALRALLAQATPGPWELGYSSAGAFEIGVGYQSYPDVPDCRHIGTEGHVITARNTAPHRAEEFDANARLIVTAINALPVLLAAVEGAQEGHFARMTEALNCKSAASWDELVEVAQMLQRVQEPTEQPEPRGRLVLNGYGRLCYDAGRDTGEREAREKLAAAVEGAQQWQPIESAPKDGTPVILFGASYGRKYWFAAHWLHCDDGSSGWIGSSFWSQPEGNWTTNMGENVTHWMPLPAPPAAASAREEQG